VSVRPESFCADLQKFECFVFFFVGRKSVEHILFWGMMRCDAAAGGVQSACTEGVTCPPVVVNDCLWILGFWNENGFTLCFVE
jgi:hypothetical protein